MPRGCIASGGAGLSRLITRVSSPVKTLSLYLPLLNLCLNLHGEHRIVILGAAMISASQIRNELAFYLAGVIPLDEFEDWFVLKTWDVSNSGSKAAEVLTFEIEAMLSDYSSEYFSEMRLKEKLQDALQSETKVAEIKFTIPNQANARLGLSFSTAPQGARPARLSAVSV